MPDETDMGSQCFSISFKLIDFFSTDKEMTIITTILHIIFLLLRLILNFFSGAPKLPSIPKIYPSPRFKTTDFSILSVWNDELSSTPKTTSFLAQSLPKLYEPAPTKAIP